MSLAVATLEQLDELPGVGPVTAQKIVDWRQTHGAFASVDDLDQIPGIGPVAARAATRSRDAVIGALTARWPTALLVVMCGGLALANWVAPPLAPLLILAGVVVALSLVQSNEGWRIIALGASLAVVGLAWGSLRTEALDRSDLARRVGEVGSARVVVTGSARSTPFALRMPVDVSLFAGVEARERALLELHSGRAPPRGAVLELVRARLVAPRGPETGFDERGWLARRGIHVVMRADTAAIVGRRGGIGGVADRLRAHLERLTRARGRWRTAGASPGLRSG